VADSSGPKLPLAGPEKWGLVVARFFVGVVAAEVVRRLFTGVDDMSATARIVSRLEKALRMRDSQLRAAGELDPLVALRRRSATIINVALAVSCALTLSVAARSPAARVPQ
jgi:hypothetical protein